MQTIDILLLIVLPYIALIALVFGTIYRYRKRGFTVSSLSSNFLERKKLFWGSVPFHFGLLILFMGHLIAFLIPEGVLAWNSHPTRLLILEISSFIFGILVFFGIIRLFLRRVSTPKIRVVSTPMDYILVIVLLLQVFLGLWTALGYRWGSSWFAAVLTPYLRSIFTLNPDISAVASMPWVIKLHIIGAYLIFLLLPFTRLVHVIVVPIQYLWRPYQQVIWNRDPKTVRTRKGHIKSIKPRNN